MYHAQCSLKLFSKLEVGEKQSCLLGVKENGLGHVQSFVLAQIGALQHRCDHKHRILGQGSRGSGLERFAECLSLGFTALKFSFFNLNKWSWLHVFNLQA